MQLRVCVSIFYLDKVSRASRVQHTSANFVQQRDDVKNGAREKIHVGVLVEQDQCEEAKKNKIDFFVTK